MRPAIEDLGLERLREPYVRHLEGRLWEIRLRGRDQIARALYVTATGRRVVIVRAFVKKTEKTPRREIELALTREKGAEVSRLRDLHEKWLEEPEYREAFERLGPEFELARALIEARMAAGLTQAELALRMGTTQSVIARLEAGRVQPTTATLQRLARATGTRLKIAFEPAGAED
jgi:phage-related protein/DNA-binding XRE family transcriptional regulator